MNVITIKPISKSVTSRKEGTVDGSFEKYVRSVCDDSYDVSTSPHIQTNVNLNTRQHVAFAA